MARTSFLTFIDLRFLLPPLINLVLSSQSEAFLLYLFDSFLNFPDPTVIIVASLLFVLAISCMICTSISVPFAFTLSNRLRMQFGHVSCPWTTSFIASFIVSPRIFFHVVLPVTILISLSEELILNLLRRSFRWLLHTLQRFPDVEVTFVATNDGQFPGDEPDTQQPELPQFESLEIVLNSAQDLPNSAG